ncbi:hypothetical protein KFE25_009666 [Diacronema lutheri]|uniref:EamA domain-containing protein n=1 Tax=Diacronema lutheri TaxID=2081491 RepID=A0A8J6CID2_DIALT|nr:hypothetical protein KFE25_009666 [Diacronema lutheri]
MAAALLAHDEGVLAAAHATAAARWATGIACILVVALIWSFASVLVQYIFLDSGFFRPFFLTYVANSLFVINLPVWRFAVWLGCTSDPHGPNPAEPESAVADADADLLAERAAAADEREAGLDGDDATMDDAMLRTPASARLCAHARGCSAFARRARAATDSLAHWAETGVLALPASRRRSSAGAELHGGSAAPSSGVATALGAPDPLLASAHAAPPPPPPPAGAGARRRRVRYATVFRIALLISPLWFAANLAYITSLALTSVTSSTIISTTSSLFTLLLSLAILDEQLSAAKAAGVALCMAGNALTALADRAQSAAARGGGGGGSISRHAILGDAVCLVGAMLYGLYTVLIRRLMADDESYSIALFFGLLGAANAIALLPVVLVLHVTGVEPLGELSAKLMCMIVVKGLFDNVLSDFLWAKAIVLTSPTAATVGLSLTIPIAMATDAALHGIHPSALGTLAALSVCAGFVLINAAGAGGCAHACGAGSAAAVLRRVRGWHRAPSARRDEPLYAVVNAGGPTAIVRGIGRR